MMIFIYVELCTLTLSMKKNPGFLNAGEDYYEHDLSSIVFGMTFEGYDFHEGNSPAWKYNGQYSTTLFTQKARDLILNHNNDQVTDLSILSNLWWNWYDVLPKSKRDVMTKATDEKIRLCSSPGYTLKVSHDNLAFVEKPQSTFRFVYNLYAYLFLARLNFWHILADYIELIVNRWRHHIQIWFHLNLFCHYLFNFSHSDDILRQYMEVFGTVAVG